MVGEQDLQRVLARPLYNHDAEDPDGMVDLGKTDHGEVVEHQPPRRRERPRHLREHQPRADGRRPQVGGASACAATRACTAHHNPKTIRDSDSYMDPTRSALNALGRAHGRAGRQAPQRLPHRDRAQQPHVRRRRPAFLSKNEDDFTEIDRLKFEALQLDARRSCRAPRSASSSMRIPAPYEVIGVLRRRDRAGARAARSKQCYEQYCVARRGPGRHPHLPASRTSRRTT